VGLARASLGVGGQAMKRIIVAVVWMIIIYFIPGEGMGEIEKESKGENHGN
jgi:hypothetical protein